MDDPELDEELDLELAFELVERDFVELFFFAAISDFLSGDSGREPV